MGRLEHESNKKQHYQTYISMLEAISLLSYYLTEKIEFIVKLLY